jgi:hypothetical protein
MSVPLSQRVFLIQSTEILENYRISKSWSTLDRAAAMKAFAAIKRLAGNFFEDYYNDKERILYPGSLHGFVRRAISEKSGTTARKAE